MQLLLLILLSAERCVINLFVVFIDGGVGVEKEVVVETVAKIETDAAIIEGGMMIVTDQEEETIAKTDTKAEREAEIEAGKGEEAEIEEEVAEIEEEAAEIDIAAEMEVEKGAVKRVDIEVETEMIIEKM